jgi:PKD repeat protein
MAVLFAACGDDGEPTGPNGAPGQPNQPPVAAFSASETGGAAPLAVTFDAGASFDPDGEIVGYEWSFGDGATATGPLVTHVYEGPGYFFPSLTVTDDRGARTTAVDSALVVTIPPGEGDGTISGTVWHDRSGDGLRAAGDPPVAGAVVFLDLDESGSRSPGEPFTVTDRDGRFAFPGVETDRPYSVSQELALGWTNTLAERDPQPAPSLPPGVAPIIGGDPAAQGEFPFMVALFHRPEQSTGFFFRCGGTFIAARWILTAAHCVSDQSLERTLPASSFEVLVGTRDLTSGGERVSVERIRVFGGFGAGSFAADDVALLELDGSFMIPRIAVQPRERPDLSRPGRVATAAGWGRTTRTGSISTSLRKVDLPLISNGECQEMLAENVVASTICAGQLGASESICSGDSGGPLMVPAGDGWIQVGVTSFGRLCQPPIAFARISEFWDWLGPRIPLEPSMSVDVDWTEGDEVRVEFGNFR